jgi:hypothetical protein
VSSWISLNNTPHNRLKSLGGGFQIISHFPDRFSAREDENGLEANASGRVTGDAPARA